MINEHIAKQRSIVLVIAMVGGELADKWWATPNKAFDMQTPAAVWLQDYYKVYTYLMRAASK